MVDTDIVDMVDDCFNTHTADILRQIQEISLVLLLIKVMEQWNVIIPNRFNETVFCNTVTVAMFQQNKSNICSSEMLNYT